MRLLVSACLLGCACRYDGAAKPCENVMRLGEEHILIPVCPEQLGGLPTPRSPAEIRAGRVISAQGVDVTDAYRRGAEETLRLCALLGAQGAVLKARSPSCGKGQVYDGSFSGTLTAGDGITAGLLRARGIPVWTEEEGAPFATPSP